MKYELRFLTVDLTTTPTQISASDLWCKAAVAQAYHDNAGLATVGNADDMTDDEGITLSPKESFEMSVPMGRSEAKGQLNLKDYYVLGSAVSGDKLIVAYWVEIFD